MCEPCKDLLPDYTPRFLCDVENTVETDGKVVVSGVSKANTKLIYWAVAPTPRGYSFSGSGLPYPSYHVGLEGSPNIGSLMTKSDGSFSFNIHMPNSYYDENGELVPPQVLIKPCDSNSIAVIDVGKSLPHRASVYDKSRTGPLFYSNCSHMDEKLPCVRSQNQILNASEYGVETNTFWGDVPPH